MTQVLRAVLTLALILGGIALSLLVGAHLTATSRLTAIAEDRAIEIAKQAVQAKDGWSDRSTEYEARQDGLGWLVQARNPGWHSMRVDGVCEFHPAVYRLIRIDTNGNITEYQVIDSPAWPRNIDITEQPTDVISGLGPPPPP
jgi:hypothetical protein